MNSSDSTEFFKSLHLLNTQSRGMTRFSHKDVKAKVKDVFQEMLDDGVIDHYQLRKVMPKSGLVEVSVLIEMDAWMVRGAGADHRLKELLSACVSSSERLLTEYYTQPYRTPERFADVRHQLMCLYGVHFSNASAAWPAVMSDNVERYESVLASVYALGTVGSVSEITNVEVSDVCDNIDRWKANKAFLDGYSKFVATVRKLASKSLHEKVISYIELVQASPGSLYPISLEFFLGFNSNRLLAPTTVELLNEAWLNSFEHDRSGNLSATKGFWNDYGKNLNSFERYGNFFDIVRSSCGYRDAAIKMALESVFHRTGTPMDYTKNVRTSA